jgi:Fic/DOC family
MNSVSPSSSVNPYANIYASLSMVGEVLQKREHEFSPATLEQTQQSIAQSRDILRELLATMFRDKVSDQSLFREFASLSEHLERLESRVTCTLDQSLMKAVPLPMHRLMITPSNAGNAWLNAKIQEYERGGDARGSNYLSLATLNTACKEKGDWDLANIFPTRTLTSAQIQSMSTQELLALKGEDFFAIIDLISGEQGMEILESNASDHRKMGLYLFNTHLAATFARKQRELVDCPLDPATKNAADQALKKFKKYGSEEFRQLQRDPRFEVLDQKRRHSSSTLRATAADSDDTQRWKVVNETFLADGLPIPVTEQMLSTWNTVFRPALDAVVPPELRLDRGLHRGLRGPRQECSQPSEHIYYLPGNGVPSEMGVFLEWLHREIAACDRGASNPIIVAALAYHKFIGIHPYTDANGRTGRCLADGILRRYQLLPAAWKAPGVATFPVTITGARVVGASDSVVLRLIEGLEHSYQIIAPPLGTAER